MMIFLLIIFSVVQKDTQTDWIGGPGVQGPVTNWGTQYYDSNDSVTTAIQGQASLVATGQDYDNWVKHIIETNLNIRNHAQGFMPADIDGDGDEDLVAHSDDEVVWYRNNGSWSYTRMVVGSAYSPPSYFTPCVYPIDLDKDGKVDILSGTYSGLVWWRNTGGGSFTTRSLSPTGTYAGYHRVSAADMDNDGKLDVIAVDNNVRDLTGRLHVFWNKGGSPPTFADSTIRNFGGADAVHGQGWRVYSEDFDGDGYLDLYSVLSATYIYINDKTRGFDSVYFYQYRTPPDDDMDGAWPSDVNMDGHMDLVTANQYPFTTMDPSHPWGFYKHINDGTGYHYTCSLLAIDSFSYYTDGSMMIDVDLDGLPDILGTRARVGYLRQYPLGTFTPYCVDSGLPKRQSNWIYAAPLGNKCIPAVDLLVTDSTQHIVYENRMMNSFATDGYLTSSILELYPQKRKLLYFGWDACIPTSSTTALAFYWRADSISGNISSDPWQGPYYATKNIDSVALPQTPCYRYFQYKADFKPYTTTSDIAVLYEVWVSHDTCISGGNVEEIKTIPNLSLQVIGDKIVLSSPNSLNNVNLSIYNISGELVQTVYKGSLEAKSYNFIHRLHRNGVYLVVLKYSGGTETVKLVKLR